MTFFDFLPPSSNNKKFPFFNMFQTSQLRWAFVAVVAPPTGSTFWCLPLRLLWASCVSKLLLACRGGCRELLLMCSYCITKRRKKKKKKGQLLRFRFAREIPATGRRSAASERGWEDSQDLHAEPRFLQEQFSGNCGTDGAQTPIVAWKRAKP